MKCERCEFTESQEHAGVAALLGFVNILTVSADVALYFFDNLPVHILLFSFHAVFFLLMIAALVQWWRLRRKEKWQEKLEKIASAGAP